jgi:DNA polymerase-1
LIASTDDDLKQLVSENVYSYPFKDEVLSLEDVEKYFGVHPSKVPLLRSISGDTSDNIPGIPRIPTEVKIRLASQCSNIPELLNLIDNIEDLTVTQSQKLKSGKDIIRRNYDLMNLRDQSVEPSFYGKKDSSNNEILDLCRELELNSLLDHKSWDLVRKCQSVQNESSEVLDL